MFDLSAEVGLMGYEAVRACKRVQVERPRASTSGGQFGGGPAGGCEFGGREERGRALVLGEERVDFLVWAAQSAKEVQVRQLEMVLVFCLGTSIDRMVVLRFPVFPQDDALGEFLLWSG